MSGLDLSTYQSTNVQGSYSWTDTLKGIYYGPGSIVTALPKLFATLNGSKALVVTGKSLYTKTDVVKKVEGILKDMNAFGGTFYEIGEHSPIAGIRNGLKMFRDNGCDIIVSVGGGSPIDASKAILYFKQQEDGGELLYQIAIPTTLSAAEYTIGSGYTNDEGKKVAVSNPRLAPSGIILDAELTLATPERLWLSTGIRALDHAVENLYRSLIPPPLKHMCYAAIVDLVKYLPESKANPQSVEVRQKLQVAAWMSLWPVKLEKYSALGLSHAMGHKIGAAYGIPHGITSCLTLAPVVKLKAEVASQEDKEWLAGALFHLRKPSTGSLEGDVVLLGNLIDELVTNLGLKSTLTQYKVPKEDIPSLTTQSVGSENDPTYDKVFKIFESLY
ncbi:alcohol dehydrogenase iv [Moniliophthora roreri MCA 2997]|uniref:Alcohol dehydrogenase iv n=2 Tax=Moniliophthora roreri TaxID=221103 RepID=V2WL43_MONRO|nr:alcohol dehydrogenase iv [Moniliophthora roreri MCA 2997]KAI3597801.1 alcohol dehydrogenase iv [Moniliophthora roreri]